MKNRCIGDQLLHQCAYACVDLTKIMGKLAINENAFDSSSIRYLNFTAKDFNPEHFLLNRLAKSSQWQVNSLIIY